MTGHFEIINGAEKLNTIFWADAEFEKIEIDYDCLKITIQEPNGSVKKIWCMGYIGYQQIGYWDEVVIERAEILEQHEFIEQNRLSLKQRQGELLADSGNVPRNRKIWNLLNIEFIDGSNLYVVLSELYVETISLSR